jgi:hypothetical protein
MGKEIEDEKQKYSNLGGRRARDDDRCGSSEWASSDKTPLQNPRYESYESHTNNRTTG